MTSGPVGLASWASTVALAIILVIDKIRVVVEIESILVVGVFDA